MSFKKRYVLLVFDTPDALERAHEFLRRFHKYKAMKRETVGATSATLVEMQPADESSLHDFLVTDEDEKARE